MVVRELLESNILELKRARYKLVHQMLKINEIMKEEICLELERWRQSRLKLSKNKSVESVRLGDLVMIRQTSRHDAPQFGLVTNIENQGRNGTVQLKTGYLLVTSVANLVPIGSGSVTTGLSSGENRSVPLNNMDQNQSRLRILYLSQ